MTVSSELNRKTFAMDGATTSFGTSPVVFFDSSDLLVYAVLESTGVATLLTENTHYTVSGGSGSTGTVDTSTGSSPYGAGSSLYALVILRELPLVQEVDFVNNDPSDAEVAEDALDRMVMIAQQIDAVVNRSLRQPDGDSADISTIPTKVDRASSYLAFDVNGNPIAADPTGALTAVSTFMATVLDDTTQAAAQTTLGLGTGDTVTHAGIVNTGAVTLSGDISPSQLTANQTDYAPTGFATCSTMRLTSDRAVAIYSLAGGADGRLITIHNIGSYPILLIDDDGSTGTAANRFAFNGTLTIPADRACGLQYDATTARWRLTASPVADVRDYEALMGIGDFDIWPEGTTFSSPATNTFVAGLFRVLYDGTSGTFTVDQAGGPLTTGAFNGIRWRQTVAGSGDTFRALEHRIEDGSTFNNTKATLSFLAQCETGTVTVTPTITQFFGTGGSPSADVTVSASAVTVTTTLTRFEVTVDMPSTGSKTFGSAINDCVKIGLYLPNNATFNVFFQELKFERYPYRTPFSQVPLALTWQHLQRQLQFVRINAIDKADAAGEQTMEPLYFNTRMRATPTATITTGSARTNLDGSFPVTAALTAYGGRYTIQSAAGGSYSALNEIVMLDARI